MNFFSRMLNIIMGRADEVVDKLERPEDKLNLFVKEMTAHIGKMQSSVAQAIADEKKMQFQIEDNNKRSVEWEQRAVLALKNGRDDLAREALSKKMECEQHSAQILQGLEPQRHATAKLKSSLQAAKDRVDSERRQYNLLIARYNTAQGKQQIAAQMNSPHSPAALVDGLNDKILRLEAEAEAQLELNSAAVGSDLEGQFLALEKGGNVDSAMAKLKASVRASGELPPGTDKVEELKRKLG